MRRFRNVLLAFGIVLLIAFPQLVLAHPEIVRTEPEAGAQLIAAPSRILITFNEAVEKSFSDIQLFDAQGQRVDRGGAMRQPDDSMTLVLPLPQLSPGLYTVIWQTVGSDGHKVVGNFVFSVLGPTSTPPPTSLAGSPAVVGTPLPTTVPKPPIALPVPTPPSPLVPVLLRVAMLLGALAHIGGWALLILVIDPALPPHVAGIRVTALAGWRRGLWLSLLFLLLGVGGFALVQTTHLAGQLNGSTLYAVLLTTRLGQTLLARFLLALVLAALLALAKQASKLQAVVALLFGGALLLTFSLSSHAAAQQNAWLPILADWLHLVATSVWVGGLIGLVFVLPPLLGGVAAPQRVQTLAYVIVRFSTLALGSVVLLTLTGTYAALLHLNVISDLWTSEYGLALLAKLVLFGGLIGLGAYNMLIVRPVFVAWVSAASALMLSWERRFLGLVRAEVLLALLTIGAVGILTNTAPPTTQTSRPTVPTNAPQATAAVQPTATEYLPAMTVVPSQPYSVTQRSGGVEVGLEVTPARLGQNMFRVTIRDAGGNPIEAQKVIVSVKMLEMDMGQNVFDTAPKGQGRYETPAGWLSMIGKWRATITVRRADADDVEVVFDVPVGE